ncbi:MAG: phenylalanine--tRNA ligase subunit beta [Gammaproteobacteria bacterium]
MKISVNSLRQYIDLPKDISQIRDLMEDLGLEVKRSDDSPGDVIFTLELLANRGDHHCYAGLAREIHGRTGWPIFLPTLSNQHEVGNRGLARVETANCLNYVLIELKKNTAASVALSPDKARIIEVSGTNLVSAAVDVTNFVNIELGQPLHAFDADKIKGQIHVREAIPGDKAQLLFETETCDVPAGTLVIADDEKIVAIAGVMGCEDAKPTDDTTRLYVESATFDPVKVRQAARHFGIQSQSSQRFERGADPALAIDGVKRAIELFDQLGWQIQEPLSLETAWNPEPCVLPLNTADVNNYFGSNFSDEIMTAVLERYGFSLKKAGAVLDVTVPSHRIWDVKETRDLYEEIARGIGYNALPASLPIVAGGVQPQISLQRKERVERLLIGEGFYEVFTDGFYSDAHRRKTGITEGHPLWRHVSILNAGDRSYSLLKNNTVTQAVELVLTNSHVKNQNVKAFEWTRTFHANASAENGVCDEKRVLWAIAYGESKTPTWDGKGKPVDVYYLKGLIEEISNLLDIPLEIQQREQDDDLAPVGLCLHPTRRAEIIWNGKTVGVFGEVHPDVLDAWGVKSGRPCFIELSQEILELPSAQRAYVPPSSLHPVLRDVCLLLPPGLPARQVADDMQRESDWLSAVDIRDVFNTPTTTAGKNAVTFSLSYSLEKAQKTQFTGEEINQETERVVEMILKTYETDHLERR